MSKESIKKPPGSDDTFAPSLVDYFSLPDAKIDGNCLRQSIISAHSSVVRLYNSYTLDAWSRD